LSISQGALCLVKSFWPRWKYEPSWKKRLDTLRNKYGKCPTIGGSFPVVYNQRNSLLWVPKMKKEPSYKKNQATNRISGTCHSEEFIHASTPYFYPTDSLQSIRDKSNIAPETCPTSNGMTLESAALSLKFRWRASTAFTTLG
jgi:hypothetical protein